MVFTPGILFLGVSTETDMKSKEGLDFEILSLAEIGEKVPTARVTVNDLGSPQFTFLTCI